MRPRTRLASLLALAMASVAPAAPTTAPMSPFHLGPLPDGLGVNIHFTDPQPGEMQQIADAGFTWVRMDFVWQATERERGVYDFSAYDRLFASLDAFHIHPIFILDYGNPLYDPDGASPHTDASRAAMAKWAVAAVTHFMGRGAVWEMWNEPNIGFWKPKPDVDDYVKLAKTVANAIRSVAPDEPVIGPGVSGVDLTFIDACFKAGLHGLWKGVSVHPYRQGAPESAIEDYAKLRDRIANASVLDKTLPIVSGEWGYSSAWDDFDERKQAAFLPREWLINLSQHVPISIWYDWRDDGDDPHDAEHHFGTVHHRAAMSSSPTPTPATTQATFEPKPAYVAAQTLTRQLNGMRFRNRLAIGDADDVFAMLFGDDAGAQQRLVVWTSGAARDVDVPVGASGCTRVGLLGERLDPIDADGSGRVRVRATGDVQYLCPRGGSSDLLRVAAAWYPLPAQLHERTRGKISIRSGLRNPLDRPITVSFDDASERTELPAGASRVLGTAQAVARPADGSPVPITVTMRVDGLGSLSQTTRFVSDNPRMLSVIPAVDGRFIVQVDSPSGEPFDGVITLTGNVLPIPEDESHFQFVEHQNGQGFYADPADPTKPIRIGASLTDDPELPPITLAPRTYQRVGSPVVENGHVASGYTATTDGDAKVSGDVSMTIAAGPMPNTQAMEIHCTLGDGWRFAEVHPPESVRTLDGKPRALLLWVWSDGSGFSPRLRFTDSGNETFQPVADGGPMTWTGWRLLRFALDGSDHPGRWGGDGNGRIDYPIRLDTLLLLDKPGPPAVTGTVRLAGPVVEGD